MPVRIEPRADHGRADRRRSSAARAHVVDDAPDARGRAAFTGRIGAPVPARCRGRGVAVLKKLLRSHLSPYKSALLLIVFLQTVQTTAALTLPTINASIIDKGVLARNQGYIY